MVISCLFAQAARECDVTGRDDPLTNQRLHHIKILGKINGVITGLQILDGINAAQEKIGNDHPFVQLAIAGISHT